MSVIPEPNFGFDELQDLGGRGAGVELDGVELPVHEVESCVYRTPIDRAQDLLHFNINLQGNSAEKIDHLTTNEKRFL